MMKVKKATYESSSSKNNGIIKLTNEIKKRKITQLFNICC